MHEVFFAFARLIRELESQWSMHSVVRKDGQHEFKESKEMLKARILQLEAEVSSLAGKLKVGTKKFRVI